MTINNAIWAVVAFGAILVPASFAADGTTQEHRKMAVAHIGQVEEATRELYFHADRLTALQRQPSIGAATHSQHLNSMREIVNEQLKPALAALEKLSPNLPEWKQDGIDSMINSAVKLATETSAAISAHNDITVPSHMDEKYKSAVHAVAEHAQDLVRISDAAGKLALAHLEAEKAGLNVAIQTGQN